MEFESDVFLSYAHIDDQAMVEGQPGWISSLHRHLQVRLEQLLGKEARIWRDPKLQGNDVFADRLVDRLPGVAVLVSVLSPRYVKSEWCQRELAEFLKAAVATGGARVADKLRVFKVVKTPIPAELQPQDLKPALGYDFFTTERASGRQRELDLSPLSGPDAQRLYWTKLDDLAQDIKDLLTILEGRASGNAPSLDKTRGTVYVAETSSDVKERRDSIKRELLGHGYTVLPDEPLPLEGAECAAFVREQLSQCRLSVHVVGQNYGVVPDNATDSIVVLQHELAIERAAAGDFCRLIWMPPDLEAANEQQRKFIAQLETDSRLQAGAEIVKSALEDFKSFLHVRLTQSAAPKPEPQKAPRHQEAMRRIYLICDSRDIDDVQPVRDALFDEFEVRLPVFDADEADVRREHESNLGECDGALIYYGAGNEAWLNSKLRELKKIAGYGRTTPMVATGVYIAPPATANKQRFRTHEAIVINPEGPFTPSALEPFVSVLRKA
jgi:TIR domain/Domain of unknown function (DUF4062)